MRAGHWMRAMSGTEQRRSGSRRGAEVAIPGDGRGRNAAGTPEASPAPLLVIQVGPLGGGEITI